MSIKTSFFLFLSALAMVMSTAYAAPGGKDDFDRLDGHGESGVRVDVIEWEGNLELHVYPRNSLIGLGLKIDDRNSQKKVMVIAYRLSYQPQKPLIRRAILSIPLKTKFNVYKDTNTAEYDKIIISNSELSGNLTKITLDLPPKKLYPEDPNAKKKRSVASSKNNYQGQPAQQYEQAPPVDTSPPDNPYAPAPNAFFSDRVRPKRPQEDPTPTRDVDDSGTIQPFSW